MISIAFANGKGGVGKTSCSANVAAVAAASRAVGRVLFVDTDPQGNAALDLGYLDKTDNGAGLGSAIVFGGKLRPLRDVRDNLDVLPGGPELFKTSAALRADPSSRAEALAHALDSLADEYGLVVLDSPPVEQMMMRLALVASDYVIAPVATGDTAAVYGLRHLVSTLLAEPAEARPELLGAVIFKDVRAHRQTTAETVEQVTAELGGVAPVLSTTIRWVPGVAKKARDKGLTSIDLAARKSKEKPFYEALRSGKKPKNLPETTGPLAMEYVALTREILDLIAKREKDAA